MPGWEDLEFPGGTRFSSRLSGPEPEAARTLCRWTSPWRRDPGGSLPSLAALELVGSTHANRWTAGSA
ncbi:MAG: hypothetical protein DIJKHBIC_03076 [Thermoanaerobaculia bacterium]|nr:hypothetical protein [Thermoanaerobaculia bacterium]